MQQKTKPPKLANSSRAGVKAGQENDNLLNNKNIIK